MVPSNIDVSRFRCTNSSYITWNIEYIGRCHIKSDLLIGIDLKQANQL